MLLRISQIPDYLEREYGVSRCIRTIRYWVRKGYKIGDKYVKLRITRDQFGQQFTRTEWVETFVRRVGG